MRHGRAKAARKTLQFFRRTQGYRAPYNVLVDGNFVAAFAKYKLPLRDRVERLLQVQQQHSQQSPPGNGIGRTGTEKHHHHHQPQQQQSAIRYFCTKSSLDELDALEQYHRQRTQSSASACKTGENADEDDDDGDKDKKDAATATIREARDWIVRNCTEILGHGVDNQKEKEGEEGKEDAAASVAEHARKSKKKRKREGPNTGDGPDGDDNLSSTGKEIYRLVTASSDDDPCSKSLGQVEKPQSERHHQEQQKYFVASQDEDLLDALRNLGTVPLIRLARGSVLLLEQPSKVATRQDLREERRKWTLANSASEQERGLVDLMKERERAEKREQEQQKGTSSDGGDRLQQRHRKRKKAKEPNPLSCKKKKR